MLLIKNKCLRQIAGLVETFSFLSLKLLIKNPSAFRRFPGRLFREYMQAVEKDKWLCKDIFDILDVKEGMRISLEHIPGHGIDTPLDELAYLAIVAKAASPKSIFEIGTFRGRTALNFAMNAPDECAVYTLDLSPEERGELMGETNVADKGIIERSFTGVDYRNKDVSHKIKQLYGNSMEFDFGPYHGKMDIVFVDGAHDYEVVLADTRNALKMVKPGGVILWHDFANYGDYNDVVRAVLDVIPGERITQINGSQLALYREPWQSP